MCAVVASNHAYDSLPPTARDVLADPAQIELGPLSRQEALTTMRNTEAYTLAPDVADYIYQSTGGAPAALYALRTGLEEYTRDNGWQQLQVTDVLTVQHRLQEKTALKAAVYRLPPSGEQAIAIRQARRQHWWQQMRLPLLVGLVILAMMLLGLYGSTRSDSTQVANAAILGDKPTPTPTFEPTPTEAPTQTPEPTPTAEPEDAAISAETPTPDQPPTPTMEPTSVISLPPGVPYPSTAVREPDDMPMRYIPAGTFTMGSAENDFTANVDEKPQHEVTLDAYYIDQYEVSVSQFAAFLNQISQLEDPSAVCDPVDCALPSSRAGFTSYLLDEDLGDGTIQYVAQAGYGSYPANHISWYGARAYCQWVGGRLPTEAEWEYAARGDDGRTYPWGEETPNPNLAVFNSESFYDLKPVDALPDGASPFGVEGMAGSVWEWTADWYSETEYERSSAVNPTGPETGLSKVMRGGSWPFNNGPDRLRTANRNSITPDFFSATIGFRCVVDPE